MDPNFLGFLLGTVRRVKNLVSLNLSSTQLDNYDADNIIAALKHRKTPIQLLLAGNKISEN